MKKTPELQTLMTGIAFGESPRWHDDRLWFSDWGAQEVIAVDLDGKSEVIVRVQFPSFPMCIDFLPNGRLLVVSVRDRLLLRMEPDGSLVTHADLGHLPARGWNEIVVDGRGNAYINGGGFDLMAGEAFKPGIVAFHPDGSARQVAAASHSQMADTADNSDPDRGRVLWQETHSLLTSRLTAACRTSGCGLTSTAASQTAFASTRKTPSGTGTSPTSVACVFAKAVRCCRRSTLTAAASLAH